MGTLRRGYVRREREREREREIEREREREREGERERERERECLFVCGETQSYCDAGLTESNKLCHSK